MKIFHRSSFVLRSSIARALAFVDSTHSSLSTALWRSTMPTPSVVTLSRIFSASPRFLSRHSNKLSSMTASHQIYMMSTRSKEVGGVAWHVELISHLLLIHFLQKRYARILEDFKKDPASQDMPLDILILCRLCEQVLREQGFRDIFKKIKLAEVFSRDGVSFSITCQNLVPQPWIIDDDLETFRMAWSKKSWKKAIIIFVDNSGADIILVILAANDLPSINDVTYSDLIEIIPKLKDEEGRLTGVSTSNLLIANSRNDLPLLAYDASSLTCFFLVLFNGFHVIDLTRVSQELAYLANDVDLVMLEGMVKHPEVAEFLGSCLYDCITKYDEV
ncbi:hypothetical protein JHK87_031861 [Glycine soja]|nr:hypothetical protein JHK87_031861 [Glycine soja]